MKFCPECGNITNGATKCDACGYDRELDKRVEMPKPEKIEPCLTYIELDELKRRKLDRGALTGVSFSSSGGMLGGYNSTDFDFVNKKITIVSQEWHHAPRIVKIYEIKDDLEEIKKIILENNLAAWSEITVNREMIAMDAPTGSTCIKFEEGSSSIHDNIYMTEEESAIMRDFYSKLNSLIKEENLIKEETVEQGESNVMGMGMMTVDGLSLLKKEQGKNMERRFCPECGTMLSKDIKECTSCGHKFGE